jgi:hypothetical protein
MLDRNASSGFPAAGMSDLYRVVRGWELAACIFSVFVNKARFCTITSAIFGEISDSGCPQFSEIASDFPSVFGETREATPADGSLEIR